MFLPYISHFVKEILKIMKRLKDRNDGKKIYYAGIGSHSTPEDVLDIMVELGYLLAEENYILRSGGSPGADTAFEAGAKKADGQFEIYLPWDKFQDRSDDNYLDVRNLDNFNNAKRIAKKHHPNFAELSESAKLLITRDTYQVLGKDLTTPSKFVVCWTPDGCITDRDRSKETGGTGQAISIASRREIPIFNLKLKEHRRQVEEWINKLS